MELGLSNSQNLVQQVPWISHTMNSSFDLFKLTSEMDQPRSECQAGSLNQLCGDLSCMPSLFGTGFAYQSNFNSPSTSFRSAFEANVIHESLKVIPIYHEVLLSKSQEITLNSKSKAESSSLTVSKLAGDYQNQISFATVSKEWENYYALCNLYGAVSQTQSTVQSLSIKDSHSENSLVLTEKNMNNDLESNKLTNERMFITSAPGYILLDNKESSRKTKYVTNCEHVDRKHYAKGLCSSCYHKGGRTKLAWNCPHNDRVLYAKGCCQECYSVIKRQRKQREKQMKSEFNSLHGMFAMNGYN